MREILFRGKRLDNGEWVYGDLIQNIDSIKIREHEKDINRIAKSYSIDTETAGQYTGLKDKNGNRIFEGDMCRVTRPCVLAYGKITFRNGCFWFVDDSEGGMLRLCDVKIDGFQIEVIVNIYDNPELISEEQP